MKPGGDPQPAGPWEPAVEPTLPGMTPSRNYISVNTISGEERGRPTTYAAALVRANQLNKEEKANAKK
jgi:hypothetical protein